MVQFNDKTYTFLKWFCLIFLPAVSALISAISSLYGYDATKVCGIITSVSAFIGTLIGVSSKNYYKDDNGGKDNE